MLATPATGLGESAGRPNGSLEQQATDERNGDQIGSVVESAIAQPRRTFNQPFGMELTFFPMDAL